MSKIIDVYHCTQVDFIVLLLTVLKAPAGKRNVYMLPFGGGTQRDTLA